MCASVSFMHVDTNIFRVRFFLHRFTPHPVASLPLPVCRERIGHIGQFISSAITEPPFTSLSPSEPSFSSQSPSEPPFHRSPHQSPLCIIVPIRASFILYAPSESPMHYSPHQSPLYIIVTCALQSPLEPPFTSQSPSEFPVH